MLGPMLPALRIPVLPYASPRLTDPRLASSREDHPAVHRGGTPLTSAARSDTHRVCHALHNVTQTDLVAGNEARKPHFAGRHLGLFCHGAIFVLHGAPLMSELAASRPTLLDNRPMRSAMAARYWFAGVLRPQ